MSPSIMQLTSRLRTWVLVAGLTALLVGFGALLGGSFVWLFAAVAIAINATGYWFSDRIALRAARAQPVGPEQAPELHAIVAELAAIAQLPTPRVFVMPGEQPNAFATGRNARHAAIAVTAGMLDTVPADEIRGVLAHEMAHIRNHDILISSVAAMIAAAISAVATMLQFAFLFGGGGDEEEGTNPLAALAMIVLAPIGAMLLQLAVSRQREYLADATAARMLGTGRPLAQALATITGQAHPPLVIPAASAPMYITNPLARGTMASLFATHPPVQERIARLLAYDQAPVRRRPLRGSAGSTGRQPA
jgi:heat shock protein HtpX